MKLEIQSKDHPYPIFIEEKIIHRAKDFLDFSRKILILTDKGIPKDYIRLVEKQIDQVFVFTLEEGEKSKSLSSFEKIHSFLLEKDFHRQDAILAIGGGMVGDIAGFVAATFMRGIDFYNIPTSLLAQVDSSIGGKTAINFQSMKNILGSFYPPQAVLIDPTLLQTLEPRQIAQAMAEVIKMAACFDPDFFHNLKKDLSYQEIIVRSLQIKQKVIEKDEKERGLRKILNFGHTLGHAIEANSSFLHGEAIAQGMLYCSSKQVREELLFLYQKYDLVKKVDVDMDLLLTSIKHDKKGQDGKIQIVYLEEIGKYKLVFKSIEEIEKDLRRKQ